MLYNKTMSPEMRELYTKRIENCVSAAERCDKDSWAYKYWMQVAGKLTRDLASNSYAGGKQWNISS